MSLAQVPSKLFRQKILPLKVRGPIRVLTVAASVRLSRRPERTATGTAPSLTAPETKRDSSRVVRLRLNGVGGTKRYGTTFSIALNGRA